MARRDQSNARKLELLNQLAVHRREIKVKKQIFVQQISEGTQQLKDSINIPKLITNKIKSSFMNRPAKWFIGSTLGGLIISKLFFKNKLSLFKKDQQPKVSKGMLYTLTVMVARPLLRSFLIGKAKDYVAQRFLGQQQVYGYDYQNYQDGNGGENSYYSQ